jgi:hypothetical protein
MARANTGEYEFTVLPTMEDLYQSFLLLVNSVNTHIKRDADSATLSLVRDDFYGFECILKSNYYSLWKKENTEKKAYIERLETMTSMHETSMANQRLAIECLDKLNEKNRSLQDTIRDLESQLTELSERPPEVEYVGLLDILCCLRPKKKVN